MPFAAGDVLVLPFPYSDRLAEKRRPAVVVSAETLERDHSLVWVAMITSDRGQAQATDRSIADRPAAGLPAPSLVRPTKLATIEPARVIRVAGRLQDDDLAAVLGTVRAFVAPSSLAGVD